MKERKSPQPHQRIVIGLFLRFIFRIPSRTSYYYTFFSFPGYSYHEKITQYFQFEYDYKIKTRWKNWNNFQFLFFVLHFRCCFYYYIIMWYYLNVTNMWLNC